mgnify:CR=1 FL=1
MATMQQLPQNIRHLLAQTGLLTQMQIGELLGGPRAAGESLVAKLIKTGIVPEEALMRGLAEVLGLSFTRIAEHEIDPAARGKVPTKVVFQYNVMPMHANDGTLVVACNDPFNLAMVESIQRSDRKSVV